MHPQYRHGILPQTSADEQGREGFLASMRRYLTEELYGGNQVAYEKRQVPAFIEAEGRAPATYQDVRLMMQRDPFFRAFSLLNRATQELLWDTVGESVARQLPSLVAASSALASAGGSLTLDPAFVTPDYASKVDIHVMPGGFHRQLGKDDLFAGALYDRGVYLYAYGGLGERNDGLGVGTAQLVRERFPDLAPKRILDMGCGVGHSTLPLADAFPDAEVFAIDIAAPMLRYAHARAESLGMPVHYSQQNAADTNFAAGSFDLVVSTILLHEIPQKITRRVIAECHRLLGPGGVMVHNDMVGWPTEAFEEFMTEWNSHHNNEPFERGSGTLDWRAACRSVGFAADDVFLQPIDATYLSEQLAYVGFRGAVRR